MGGILGIISEYNPFHNGHIMHLQKSLKLSKADFSIAIMSGNFVQRGEPSIIDKWSKTELALRQGIDLVIELPTIYSISSAENFANRCNKNFKFSWNYRLSFIWFRNWTNKAFR